MKALDLPNGISLSPDGDVAFSGKSGRTLLLGLLLRAKFARPLERHAVLNGWMTRLAKDLSADWPSQDAQDGKWDADFRDEVAACILQNAKEGSLPWWTMTEDERIDFIRDVAFAPHSVSKFDAEEVVLAVQDEVLRAERLVTAVAKATGK
ncbi:MAG: hypothetical protein ACT6RD_02480 [Brevundimonas sp.]|uniref:hypothetical protein n=1 Tax=Brevundimonas sp. TaxID=1871086 RepID=UPI004034878B